MQIIRDYESDIYNLINRSLGNCYTAIIGNAKYYFEFEVNKNQAKIIIADKMSIILDVINEFRKNDSFINIFYNEDRTFYKAFDEKFTFKLPINIIQPSKFFVNKERLNAISSYLMDKEIYLPVTIINDEYVLVDGHARLLAKYLEDQKMINVYVVDSNLVLDNLVYIAKEHNIVNIKAVKPIGDNEYNEYINMINEALQY